MIWLVKLTEDCWLAPVPGDACARTCVLSSAKQYATHTAAERALTRARVFRPFAGARVVQAHLVEGP